MKSPSSKSIIANFSSLAASPAEQSDSVALALPVSRVGAGVIGATQRTLSDIREERDRLLSLVAAGGWVELDPELVDPSPFPDRLPDDGDREFSVFRLLMAEEGQKIPIQVRPHASVPGRYQIVFGHRRWRACRELGIKVKAAVVTLSDDELVVVQGIENAARQDLSWVERAIFAWRMSAAGIKARDIRAALGIDDPELARFRLVCRVLSIPTILLIGRCPGVGRPRWVEFANLVNQNEAARALINETLADDKVLALDSNGRFRHLGLLLSRSAARKPDNIELKAPSGEVIGRAAFSGADVKLVVDRDKMEAFSSFMRGEIPYILERFFARMNGVDGD